MLYAMMALAAWLVWRRGGDGIRLALTLFAVQLALNVAWSGLFFALRLPGAAFAEILLLWLAIGATTLTFGRISTAAALLFVPYFAWVGFAAILNLAIWRLNA
jgi:tryptophan-rich sensory protein